MNKYEFYSKLLQEDFPVKYHQDFAEHDSEQCKKIADLKAQLAEAVGLGKALHSACVNLLYGGYDRITELGGDCDPVSKMEAENPAMQKWKAFLDRHAQAEQQEACDYCGPGKHTGLPGGACENCMGTGLKYPEQE